MKQKKPPVKVTTLIDEQGNVIKTLHDPEPMTFADWSLVVGVVGMYASAALLAIAMISVIFMGEASPFYGE